MSKRKPLTLALGNGYGEADYEGYQRMVIKDLRRHTDFPMCTGGSFTVTQVAVGPEGGPVKIAPINVMHITPGVTPRVRVKIHREL